MAAKPFSVLFVLLVLSAKTAANEVPEKILHLLARIEILVEEPISSYVLSQPDQRLCQQDRIGTFDLSSIDTFL